MNARRNLLWIDCAAGAIVGVAVLLLDGWISRWTQLPQGLVFFMGVANLAYASYSFSLAVRRERTLPLINLLVAANLGWAVLLIVWALVFSDKASWLGFAYLLSESLFVGGLAVREWRSRHLLQTA